MNLYFDKEGRPLSTEEWARLFEDNAYRRVALGTRDLDGVQVSTVWLGLNHRVGPGTPLIFETALSRESWEPVAGHEGLMAGPLPALPETEPTK